jgi:hypothetical protein
MSSMISHGNQILIGGHKFLASLIVLNSASIDVILGMDWLKANKAIIDFATKFISLAHPSGQIVYYPTLPSTTQVFSLEVSPLPPLESVPVVCDFLDVFPEELLGMPPNRAVEFVIELEPGTAPISKRPYKMGPKELAKLKKQLDEQEKLGFIQASTSSWGSPKGIKLIGCVWTIEISTRRGSRISIPFLEYMISSISRQVPWCSLS